MASDVAHSEPLAHESSAPLTNGDHDNDHDHNINSNADAFGDNAALQTTDTSLKVNSTSDQRPGGPTPIEDIAPGIAPVAGFIPKDARTSHPTPPPDEPLAISEANVDTEMIFADEPVEAEPVTDPTAPLSSSIESTLVRQREDDDDDEVMEPVAKRSKVEIDGGSTANVADVPVIGSAPSEPKPMDAAQLENVDQGAAPIDALPDTKPAVQSLDTDVSMESQPEQSSVTAPEHSVEVGSTAVAKPTSSEAGMAAKPQAVVEEPATAEITQAVPPTATPVTASATTSAPAVFSPSKIAYSTKPVTKMQQRFLVEKMKNLKKTKNSTAFLNPVDPVALNIPTYTEIVKSPMDLSTMEKKLKDERYSSVQDFANDFDLIIANSRAFNGDQHPVTQAGYAMEAYFRKMMESVPSADQPVPLKAQAKKAASPKPSSQAAVRREPRAVAAPSIPQPAVPKAGAQAVSAGETFALQADGTPQIRRESTTNRPARAIKPPPARELPYSKPKRKEHQLELKFCDHILSQLKSNRYSRTNIVFLQPVDPVALNIPQYRQIVKHPMDLSTMSQKLKHGEYAKAAEFKKDFELMIDNCLAFNPHGNPVRDLGIEFRREFEALWTGKEKWEKAQKHAQRTASASGDEDSAEEEEEDDEEAGDDDKEALIQHLQKQLAEMQNLMTGLKGVPKQKKSKVSSKAGHKKATSASKPKVATKPKAPKKVKQVTYEEKQEISEAVGRMNEDQVAELTRIITENCKKYADQEEMELEIDDLPNDVQAMLLKYVRSIFGNPTRTARAVSPDDMAAMDDDDFEPERGPRRGGAGGGSKRKKHKPMGKAEQAATIESIERKLSQFKNVGGSASQSPAADADTSGDEESEESEEE